MRRATRWRPWQFGLRFLLLMTALIAVVFGWRARQVERQRQAVAEVHELGGSVEYEAVEWAPAHLIPSGCESFLREVAQVDVWNHRGGDVATVLPAFGSLKKVRLFYDKRYLPARYRWIGGQGVFEGVCMEPCHATADKLRQAFPGIDVEVCDATPDPSEWWRSSLDMPAAIDGPVPVIP